MSRRLTPEVTLPAAVSFIRSCKDVAEVEQQWRKLGAARLVDWHGGQADKTEKLALPAMRVHGQCSPLDMVWQMHH